MLHDPASVRAGFAEATAAFLRTVEHIEPHQWALPALGEWNVRELTAHALRAFTTTETYLGAEPTVDRVMADATEYYRTVLADPDVHRSVAQRGHAAGTTLDDPLGESQATAQRVGALVASTADDDTVHTFAGQIGFIEYLATRVVELGVHTLDLQRATGQYPHLHRDTVGVVLSVLTDLAEPPTLILALTGRGSLPAAYNVLG
jgi:Mycothiol maleylpyruvate isomerase N-terminal domain